MRKLIASFLIVSLNTFATPTGYRNETATVPTYTQNLVAPNNQFTKQAGLDSRIETGNENLLANPSFEAATASTSWTKTGPTNTFTDETTSKVSGKKSLKFGIVTTSATGVRQDSTINASDLAGLQGAVSIYVKTAITGVQVCPRAAGVVVSASCVNVLSDNTWRQYVIPTILNGTSNGIEIQRTSLTTGDVYLDNAFVGLSSPFQNAPGAKLMGTLRYSATAGCQWSTSSTTYTNLALNASCPTPTVTGNAVAPATKIPAITFTSLPAGTYYVTAQSALQLNTASISALEYARITDGTNFGGSSYVAASFAGGSVNASGTNLITAQFTYTTTQSNITFQPQVLTTNASNPAFVYAGLNDYEMQVYYYPPESKIYSQASQDYAYTNAGAITIGATTTAPTKGTITTDRIMASRKGQNLVADYQYEQSGAGTAGSGDYLYTLPSGLSFDTNIVAFQTGTLISVSNSARSIVGSARCADTSTATQGGYLVAYDSTRFRAVCNYTGNTSFIGSGNWGLVQPNIGYNFKINAPISGWQDYGVIVGSFAGIEKCANDYECTDTFSAKISNTGVVSGENLDWINGNCSQASNVYTCTYNSFLKDGVSSLSNTMNCTTTAQDTGRIFTYMIAGATPSDSTKAVVNQNVTTTNAAATDTAFILKCQKGTNDYKPKTAKVAIPFTQVFAKYRASTGDTTTSTNNVNFDVKVSDSHNAVTTNATTWKFTAPISGTYLISACLTITTGTHAIYLQKNGATLDTQIGSTTANGGCGSTIMPLLQNDYVGINNGSGTTATLSTDATANTISISRLGEFY